MNTEKGCTNHFKNVGVVDNNLLLKALDSKSYLEKSLKFTSYLYTQNHYDFSAAHTENCQRPEFFAWKDNIAPHVDITNNPKYKHGYVYLLPLSNTRNNMYTEFGINVSGNTYEMFSLRIGNIYRFDERLKHFAFSQGITFSLFCGTFTRVCDKKVTTMFNKYLKNLGEIK